MHVLSAQACLPNKGAEKILVCYHRSKCTVPHSQQVCRQRADSVQTARRQRADSVQTSVDSAIYTISHRKIYVGGVAVCDHPRIGRRAWFQQGIGQRWAARLGMPYQQFVHHYSPPAPYSSMLSNWTERVNRIPTVPPPPGLAGACCPHLESLLALILRYDPSKRARLSHNHSICLVSPRASRMASRRGVTCAPPL